MELSTYWALSFQPGGRSGYADQSIRSVWQNTGGRRLCGPTGPPTREREPSERGDRYWAATRWRTSTNKPGVAGQLRMIQLRRLTMPGLAEQLVNHITADTEYHPPAAR
jgi:hypothetical protein